MSNTAVAAKYEVTVPTVGKWRRRFVTRRLAGLVNGAGDYATAPQRKWLERIGKQLHKESVIDRETFSEGRWRDIGGFDAANRIFDGKLEPLLGDLQAEIWCDSA